MSTEDERELTPAEIEELSTKIGQDVIDRLNALDRLDRDEREASRASNAERLRRVQHRE
ncbi:hypothetical protein [Paraburkholderia sacchari]|uniref:hypothetical protein n=1 Tax=Paraburkholderia sacchari TaxID=159450 RepID=UPI0039A4FFE1